ncbi:MAG TPA: alanine dehydrogenase [Clostridiales bacterium]|jgi:alanine dehydrogenase|nr:alanine dehydrogenase [Clostridiales bacterium]
MIFGILKDIKEGEYRVICTPTEVATIVGAGHIVLTQKDCGKAAGFSNEAFKKAGAEIVDSAEEMYRRCDMVAKVKEFEESEYGLIRENQIILGCIHPAGHPEKVDAILKSKCIAFTAEDCHRYGSPNCEAAGKQGALFGLESMLTINGGKGKYVGGFAGAPGMNVLILGGGIVGQNALSVLYALGANVTVMDINVGILRMLSDKYNSKINTMFCTKETIASVLPQTDMVINAVKWPKHRKDFLIDKEMLKLMEPGSVLVDISNDDPGAIESSHETHHDNPRYVVNGVVHYCVSNIPGAVAHSTSVAYAAEMLPAILSILNDGVVEACVKDGYLRRSLTAYKGYLTHEETSGIQNKPWIPPEVILGIKDRELDYAPPATTTKSTNYYVY